MSTTWVFGYGSLVSPRSLDSTLGRAIDRVHDLHVAHLSGYGRRWNYGSQRLRGDWHHGGSTVEGGVVVSLGLEPADETCNGVVFRVDEDELERLDRRESDYERTDVSDLVRLDDVEIDEVIVTYVPRPSAVERYQTARAARRAAVRREYWDLVHEAFAALGSRHLAVMEATPLPDVPVADVRLIR